MDRQRVESSNLASIGYDADAELLEVEFQTGSIYQYASVPATIYERLMAARSHGQFFNSHIKAGGYRVSQLR